MAYHIDSFVALHSFDHIYATTIKPKLEEIDIFLKTNEAPFSQQAVADLLNVTYPQLLNTMQTNAIIELNNINFFQIIAYLQSPICTLISKQWKYNFLDKYTPEVISDIYNLEYSKVKLAFEEIGASTVDPSNLSCIFKRIHVTVFN